MVLDGKSSQEYPVNAGVPQLFILSPTPFLLYINDFPDDVICDIAIYADDTTLYSKRDQASNFNWLLNLNLINETLWTGARRGLLISMLGNKQDCCSFICCFSLTLGSSSECDQLKSFL